MTTEDRNESTRSFSMVIIVITGLVVLILIVSTNQNIEGAPNKMYVFVAKWDGSGLDGGKLVHPEGISIDTNTREMYLTDTQNDRIQKFLLSNQCPITTKKVADGVCFIKAWGGHGLDNGKFDKPYGVAVDSSTHEVFVVDRKNSRVQKFTSDGTYVSQWGRGYFGVGNTLFKDPIGIALDVSTREAYVTDLGSARVLKFLLSDTCPITTKKVADGVCFIKAWGGHGLDNGKFDKPYGIAVDSTTHYVYVSDTGLGYNIQKFTSNGEYFSELGSWGHGDGQLNDAGGIALDQGSVYVADGENNRIQKFTNDGKFVAKVGSFGWANGQLSFPRGVAVDPSTNYVYVADTENSRVQAFALKTINPQLKNSP